MTMGQVALVEDDADLRHATAQTLELAGYEVLTYGRASEALAGLAADFPGILVSDIRMPGMDGLTLYSEIRKRDTDLPVILITGHGDIAMAVQAIHDGVYDFIAKPFATDRLVQSIGRAMEKRRLILENRNLRRQVESAADDLPLIGQTPAMEHLRHTLRQIADTDVDVLVRGETGSGKEVVASLLHRLGHRAKGNFVAINCGALPESVIESELFGHETGAFTGAQKKRIGRIEHSSGGTLFLDEIESMPPATQVKFLRILEMREVSPLGTNEVRPVDLRVVAAAKVDLGNPAERGDFREDLYYRLNVVTLTIPPLRDRRDDIPLLFAYFAKKAARRFNRDLPRMERGFLDGLLRRDWPGNVRELGHVAERFVLGLETFEPEGEKQHTVTTDQPTLSDRIEAFEADQIRKVLQETGGDVQATISALGIARKTFYDKLQRHGINRAEYAK
jgi:two-component system C4-dicarboxylate transport response regulator DctD